MHLVPKALGKDKHDAFLREHHRDHETFHELDHRFDHQHDVEPVHYHEHAIEKALPLDTTDSKDIIDLQQDYSHHAEHKKVDYTQMPHHVE